MAEDRAPSTLAEAVSAENQRRAAGGRRQLPVVEARRQVNHGGNESWQPALAFRPSSDIEELVDVMQFLHASMRPPQELTVKAGGSRHSWSRAAASNGVYIHPEAMNFVTPVASNAAQAEALRDDFGDRDDCFLVGSGTQIREVNDTLWSHAKALPVLGGYDGQTVAGVIQTGTHGSVLRSGPISDVVLSINLVDAEGRRIRIERTDGPTDATRFAAGFPDWVLHQEDDLFDAALISVGAFGVVHSYFVRAMDAFYLRETRSKTTLTALRELLRGGNIYRLMDVDVPADIGPDDGRRLGDGHEQKVYHLEFLVNPHPVSGDHTVIFTSRARFEFEGPEPEAYAHTRSDAKNLFRVLGRHKRFSRPTFTTWVSEHFPWLLGILPNAVMQVLPGSVAKLLDFGMLNLVDEAFEGRSYNVFNIGHGQNNIPALSSEPSVPLRDDLYLQALDLILERAANFANHGKYHTGPLSMRFVAGTKAMLGDPEDVCRFEIIFTAGTGHAVTLMRDYEDALFQRFGGDVRPHWGQVNNLTRETRSRLAAMYPRLQDWQQLRQQFDADSLSEPMAEGSLPVSPL